MTEKEIKYWELIVKEQDQSINEAERAELESWRQANVRRNKELMDIFRNTKEASPDFVPEKDWEDLRTMIEIEEDDRRAGSVRLFPWFARAAAAALVILGVIYIYNYQSSTNDELVLQTMIASDRYNLQQAELPDGTLVWLNKESELLFPEHFSGKTREVYLKGEAFFDVAHNNEKPFIIHAGISKTTVLGTSFNLRAYGKEGDIRLTVVSGKVAFTLADDRERVTVTPGNMAMLNRDTKSISRHVNKDLNFLSWKTKELIFDDCLVSDLLFTLSRHYGIEIMVENDETNLCHFTGNFKDTELDNALKIITKAIGSTYQKTEGHYLIKGIGCQ